MSMSMLRAATAEDARAETHAHTRTRAHAHTHKKTKRVWSWSAGKKQVAVYGECFFWVGGGGEAKIGYIRGFETVRRR